MAAEDRLLSNFLAKQTAQCIKVSRHKQRKGFVFSAGPPGDLWLCQVCRHGTLDQFCGFQPHTGPAKPVFILGSTDAGPNCLCTSPDVLIAADALFQKTPGAIDVLRAGFHFQDFPAWKFVRHNSHVLWCGPSSLAFSDDLLLAMNDRVVDNSWHLGLVRFGGVCVKDNLPILRGGSALESVSESDSDELDEEEEEA